MDSIKLIIAQSNFIITEGLKSVFSAVEKVEISGIAKDSDTLTSMLMETGAQVLLIDYSAQGFHSSDVLRSLRISPGIKIVAMTTECDVTTVRKLLEAGLYGHLMSDCDHEEIIDSVISCSRGDKFFCGKVLDKLNNDFGDPHGCDPIAISERELEILQLVAQGLTTKQIADRIHLSFHTVMTHRKNIMNKLGINNTAGLIIYAVRENLISPNKFLFSETRS
ncbi:MAG: response regulator transcription factor [Flavobacteriales bacterium]